jgi:hypothetical protein
VLVVIPVCPQVSGILRGITKVVPVSVLIKSSEVLEIPIGICRVLVPYDIVFIGR